MRTALLFPGQGSQRPGMLAALPDHPLVRAAREEASAALGRDWRELDRAEALARTDGAQAALLIEGVAAGRALLAEGGKIDVVAGHSVGAFAAAVIAEVLSFEEALALVALRGRLMAESHPFGFGMTAILGLRDRAVAALVEQARDAGPLYVANRNAPLQTVVSGADAALDRVVALALEAGARKVERLAVATPSHCPLVAPVADALVAAIADIDLAAPKISYVSARTARLLRSGDAIGDDLARNVAEPVRWGDVVALLGELGAVTLIQAPPGATLSDLATEALPEARAVSMDGLDLASTVSLSLSLR